MQDREQLMKIINVKTVRLPAAAIARHACPSWSLVPGPIRLLQGPDIRPLIRLWFKTRTVPRDPYPPRRYSVIKPWLYEKNYLKIATFFPGLRSLTQHYYFYVNF